MDDADDDDDDDDDNIGRGKECVRLLQTDNQDDDPQMTSILSWVKPVRLETLGDLVCSACRVGSFFHGNPIIGESTIWGSFLPPKNMVMLVDVSYWLHCLVDSLLR